MKDLMKVLCSVALLAFAIGCGPGEGTGHTDDETPGGEPTKAADELMDDKAMDEYSKNQGGAK